MILAKYLNGAFNDWNRPIGLGFPCGSCAVLGFSWAGVEAHFNLSQAQKCRPLEDFCPYTV